MSLGHTLAYSSASPRSLHQPSSASCADVFLVLLHPHLAEDPKLRASSCLHFLNRPRAIMMHLP